MLLRVQTANQKLNQNAQTQFADGIIAMSALIVAELEVGGGDGAPSARLLTFPLRLRPRNM